MNDCFIVSLFLKNPRPPVLAMKNNNKNVFLFFDLFVQHILIRLPKMETPIWIKQALSEK